MRTRHLIILILACLFQMQFVFSQTNKLYIVPTDCPLGKTTEVQMQMDNRSEVVALQFNLHIPDVVKLDPLDIKLVEERKDDHRISVTDKGNNNYLVVIMSGSNKAFKQVSGAVLTIPLAVPDDLEVDKEYPFELTNVVLADRSGKNVMTSFDAGKIKIVDGNGPDITPKNIQLRSEDFKPGGKVALTWNVENIGGKVTDDGWSEWLYLVDELGNEYALGNTSYRETLAAKSSVSREAEFTVGNYPGIEGNVKAKVVLKAFSEWELPVYKDNNECESQNQLVMPKVLTWSVNATVIREQEEAGILCTLNRSGSRMKDETFTVRNGNAGRLNLPSSVTIPQGESGVSFQMNTLDNKIANSDSFVVVTISGNAYPDLKKEIWIEDDEHPYLKMSVVESEVKEGGKVTMKLEREWTINWPLSVRLKSDHPKRFENFPSEVVIPAGTNQVTVTLNVIDDDQPGLDDEVVFTASAPGHVFDLESNRFVKILDDDMPDIDLELSTTTASEATQTIVATLKRTGVTTNKATVHLTNDGNGRISMPASIVLEAGVTEKQFAITTVDNAMKDGDKVIKITGAIYLSSCNCSTAGSEAGVFEKQITVLDDDDARVTSNASKTTLLEGEKGKITVTVNEVLSAPLTVKLSCDNNEIQLPVSVTIPAGSRSADVEISVPKNEVSEGNRVVTVVMDAGSYGKSTCWLNITDQTLPDAVVTAVQTEGKIPVSGSAKVSVTVKNEGAAPLSAQTKVSVYLSTGKSLNSNSVALGNLYTQNELAVGESVTLEKNLVFPEKTGDYHLLVVVNEEQTKKELSYINNTSTPFAVTLTPLYTAQVSLDKSVLKTGESVMITGQVTGSKTSGVPVDLYVINNGYRKVISVTTDNSGVFQKSFTPENWQMGHFSVGACYPDEGLKMEMSGFDLYGLKKATNGMITWEVFTNEKKTGAIKLSNPGNKALSNVTAKIVFQPQNCQIRFSSISAMAANGTADLQYEVTGTAVSPGTDWEPVKVQVTSAEGVVLDLDIYYYCRSYAAQLEVSEPNINTTMTIGASREYPLTITNTGKGETGEIRVVLPNADWMSLASPAKMPSLKYGESATVLLRLAPGADMEANVAHKGKFAINCANGNGVPVSYRITPVSSESGTLVVDVCDEYTYYTDEKPHVSGAKVRVTLPNTNTVVAEGTTETSGLFTKELPAGYYTLEVTADKHDSYKNTVMVDPGKENKVVINLSFQAIDIKFEVEETTIEDSYSISTKVEFETRVPAPVVVLTTPNRIYADELTPGESLVYNVTLKNEGLITAKDCETFIPESTPEFMFESMITDRFDLKAQETVVVPIKLTRRSSGLRSSHSGSELFPGSDCIVYEGVSYFWDCGNDKKWHKYYVPTKMLECEDSQNIFSGFPFPISIKGNGGGKENPSLGTPNNNVRDEKAVGTQETITVIRKKKDCIPCQVGYIIAGLKCAYHFVPVVEEVQSAIEEVWNEFMGDKSDELLSEELDKETMKKMFEGKDFLSFLNNAKKGVMECLDNIKSDETAYKKAAECYKALEEPFETFIDDYMDKYLPNKTKAQKEIFKRRAKKVLKALGTIADILNCINDFAKACEHLEQQTKAGNNVSVPGYMRDFKEVADMAGEGLRSYLGIVQEIVGDSEEWYNCSIDEWINCMSQFNMEEQIEYDLVLPYKPTHISEDVFRNFVIRWNNTQAGKETNVINLNKIKQLTEVVQKYDKIAREKGATCIEDYFAQQYELFVSKLNESSNSVCSTVSLEFSQSMVMTRQAFRGTLTVQNGHESIAMQNVKLNLEVSDEDGLVATSHEFQINPETIDGFEGKLDGAWTLDAQKTGKATILFIPTKYAAPTEPKEYTFGGTLSYVDPFTGLEVTRDLFPVTLTVKPSPNLEMDYFMQRDILGDDPLTKDVVEPMIPSEFSLLIHNMGAGDATNVRMTTQQPKITDNEKGLLVDFRIKTSQLNGEAETAVMGESVTNDFGTIEAGKTAYAQWWLTSTLLGHFTDYKVEATHVTSFDNPDLSLLDTVRIHELIRGIRVDESVSPKVTGFMVNDIPDAEDFPDRMYLTDGTTAPVFKAVDAKLTETSPSHYELVITPSADGWNYINVLDPTEGRLKLISVNEDTNLDTRKVWQTDRTLRDGKDPKYEYRIHAVDYFGGVTTRAASSAGSFRLLFEERPEVALAVESITGLPEGDAIATSVVDKVTIKFNKPIVDAGIDGNMIELYHEGKKVEISNLPVTKQDEQTYVLDLSGLAKLNGLYTLTILTSEMKDADGFTGEEDKTVSWTQQAGGKVKLTMMVEPENAGTVSPASAEPDYNSEVELKATASTGYQFKNWTIEGKEVSTSNPYSHLAVSDQTIVANFSSIYYTVEIKYDAAQGFVSFGTGYYEYNSSLDLIATPNEGYRFIGWFKDGKRISSEELLVYKVVGDVSLEARFEALETDPDNPGGETPDNPGGEDPDDPNGGDPDDPNGGDPEDPTSNEKPETLVIQVYPTQVTDYVHVGVLPAKSRLILLDLAGKQVKQVASCEGEVNLFMGDQPSGFYLLHILVGEEQKKTVKLIKK